MSLTDQEFERALLASARADEPPAEMGAQMTAQAWVRFSARVAAVGDTLRGPAPRSESAGGAGAAHNAKRRVGGGGHWRWLLAGALGGGALTATLFALRPPTRVPSVTVGAGEASPAVITPPPALAAPISSAARLDERPPVRHERRRTQQADRPSVEATGLAALPSSLAAEVAALDAARAAAASRQFDQALTLISRYHYDFPAGELSADAEVIAIEALDAKHDRAEMSRRASRFLDQHPDDPHAARIKRLVVPQPSP
jgi:hypothetical protein